MISDAPGFEKLQRLGGNRLADAGEFFEFAAARQSGRIFLKLLENPGRRFIGADFKGVIPLEFQPLANLEKQFRQLFFVGHSYAYLGSK